MFQFPAFPPHRLCVHLWVTEVCSVGFPHSDICGSLDICSSPQLFAAYHVLLRLLVPRHPPYALISLIFLKWFSLLFGFSLKVLHFRSKIEFSRFHDSHHGSERSRRNVSIADVLFFLESPSLFLRDDGLCRQLAEFTK